MSNTGVRRSGRNRRFRSVFTNDEGSAIDLTGEEANIQVLAAVGGEQQGVGVAEELDGGEHQALVGEQEDPAGLHRREIVCGLRRKGTMGGWTKKRVSDTVKTICDSKSGNAGSDVEGRNSKKQRVTEDEDSDFVDEGTSQSKKPASVARGTTRRKISATKGKGIRKSGSKQQRRKGKEVVTEDNERLPSVRTRNSPKPLYGAIQAFSSIQKKCVVEMGFGSMLDFKIESLTGPIVYYAVNSFSDVERAMTIGSAKIKVTPELVHELLGVPIGGDHLCFDDKQTTESNIVTEWKRQFTRGEINSVDLREKIAISEEDDWNFKINFLLLFVNTMANCKKRGRCDLSLLNHINSDFEPANVDWCWYIWNALLVCKKYWEPAKKEQFYAGPCTLLTLVYVNGTEVPGFEVKRKRPVIRGWNTGTLKKRATTEVNNGGFGKVILVDPNEATEDDGDEVCVDGGAELESGRVYAFKPRGVKGYISKVCCLFELMNQHKDMLTETLVEAIGKYPQNEVLKEMEAKLADMFRDPKFNDDDMFTTPEVNKALSVSLGTGGHGAGENMEDVAGPSERMQEEPEAFTQFLAHPGVMEEIENSMKAVDGRGKLKGVVINEGRVQPIPLRVEIDETEKSKKGKSVAAEEPSFSLGLTQDMGVTQLGKILGVPQMRKDLQSVNLEVVSEEIPACSLDSKETGKGRRTAKVGGSSKSPFSERVVQIDLRASTDEAKMIKLMESEQGSAADVVFATTGGHAATRAQLATLLTSFFVVNEVIDSWASLLNIEEDRRSAESPFRLFCSTKMINENMLSVNMDDGMRLQYFTHHLAEVCDGNPKTMMLKEYDMVFFPMVNGLHNYLVVYDFRSKRVVILDNEYDNQTIEQKYRGVPKQLHNMFTKYLLRVGHAKVDRILTAEPERVLLKWQTHQNDVDSAVFVMRHMETYMGQPESRWTIGLSVPGGYQSGQITKLRKRYLMKMLMTPHNVHCEAMRKEADKMEPPKPVPKPVRTAKAVPKPGRVGRRR